MNNQEALGGMRGESGAATEQRSTKGVGFGRRLRYARDQRTHGGWADGTVYGVLPGTPTPAPPPPPVQFAHLRAAAIVT